MSVNQRVFDTAIQYKTNQSRGLGPRNLTASHHQYLIEPDGHLRVLAPLSKDEYLLKESTDNGFTWSDRQNTENWSSENITVAWSGIISEGPSVSLVKMREFYGADDVMYSDPWALVYGGTNAIHWMGSYAGATVQTVWGEISSKFGNVAFTVDVSGGYYALDGDGEDTIYAAYQNLSSQVVMIGLNINTNNIAESLQEYKVISAPLGAYNQISIKAKDDKVHTAFVGFTTGARLYYAAYNKAQGSSYSLSQGENGTWDTAQVIVSGTLTTDFIDPKISVDGYGNIGVVFNRTEPTTTSSGYYSISTDKGYTWKTIYNPPPTGYSGYYEDVTGKFTPCNDILGGISGFLISSLYMKDDSPDLFVKEIKSWVTDVGTSTEDWRQVNSVDGDVIAGKFFKYTRESTPNIQDKSSIRMVYQLGDANNNLGESSVYSTVYHEKLSNLAFPSEYTGTSFTNENIDYYASGYINDRTALYIAKIEELGMYYSFSRYDPLESSEINGRGAYGSATTAEYEACVDPGSYGFPTVARNNSDFTEYIERDVRKIFYKPNLFLSRNFILNKGGFLKRTVWTIRIMGNDYEIAQIVPRWLDGKIMYYEANLYVIGPSNDPFSKKTLPSET
jgi:hypothetical protein